ncbi:uncharacterized protein BO95DRAFT_154048 [Aspergillus brunneoviolaceus CBS 621.78]|uniref:Uncharacterized protein n=1 Tax=Aspergillus brunneoviolaceus CBS 621.78 TaxID=1450534 RepID=A0ACD1G751_9EURO|nr:hypothetical protein BO95DRAFT_154048 [Aspergillus brunneoviolaceus CBS 621.78]RAH45081.1 hypothetical protein BO95DRAFT_154048 [Aspergillus brunneoviolaceus CBS 621.78]
MVSTGRSSTVPPPSTSSPAHSDSFIRPRQPSLDLERDILSTRGQRLAGLIRRRSLSLHDSDGFDESDRWDESIAPRERMARPAFERAKRLIGDRSPFYRWQSFYRHPATLQGLPQPLYVAPSASNVYGWRLLSILQDDNTTNATMTSSHNTLTSTDCWTRPCHTA